MTSRPQACFYITWKRKNKLFRQVKPRKTACFTNCLSKSFNSKPICAQLSFMGPIKQVNCVETSIFGGMTEVGAGGAEGLAEAALVTRTAMSAAVAAVAAVAEVHLPPTPPPPPQRRRQLLPSLSRHLSLEATCPPAGRERKSW